MGKFSDYADQLEVWAASVLSGRELAVKKADLVKQLNGGAGAALERTVSLRKRRRIGAFFTGHSLRDELLDTGAIRAGRAIWDPACGAGDLLIAASDRLKLRSSLEDTLEEWSSLLAGTDREADFVRAARARLVLAAHVRGSRPSKRQSGELDHYFPHLTVGDALAATTPKAAISDILLNPPYGHMRAPEDCSWATGNVSRAAVFVAHCVSSARPTTRIAAILPDVLRTGSRYRAWRDWIESHAHVAGIRVRGRFTKRADVDVFILRLEVQTNQRATHSPSRVHWIPAMRRGARGRIHDHFHVNVGAVVPHRDAQDGPRRAFLHARIASRFGEIRRISDSRRYGGRIFRPPFVVVRRTSSPSDAARGIASLVLGQRPVAVENHLIVLTPRRGGASICRTVLDVLKLPSTTKYLNRRIRCRHLTVDAVGGIPWPKANTKKK